METVQLINVVFMVAFAIGFLWSSWRMYLPKSGEDREIGFARDAMGRPQTMLVWLVFLVALVISAAVSLAGFAR